VPADGDRHDRGITAPMWYEPLRHEYGCYVSVLARLLVRGEEVNYPNMKVGPWR